MTNSRASKLNSVRTPFSPHLSSLGDKYIFSVVAVWNREIGLQSSSRWQVRFVEDEKSEVGRHTKLLTQALNYKCLIHMSEHRTQCALRAGLEMWEQDMALKRQKKQKQTNTAQNSVKKANGCKPPMTTRYCYQDSGCTSCLAIITCLCAPHPIMHGGQNAQ